MLSLANQSSLSNGLLTDGLHIAMGLRHGS